MSIRNRTTKLIARRHDLNYFKRLSPIRAWQFYLAGAALVAAILWFGTTKVAHGDTAFSSGPISSSHAVFGQRCELCHAASITNTGFTRDAHVPDSACLKCHAASAHHAAEAISTESCGSCHTEHVGAMHLASTADRGCTQCHANLETRTGVLRVASHIANFATEHPDFRPLRTVSIAERTAAFALKFTHAEHMKAGLRGPTGPVSLNCQSCHVSALTADGRQGPNLAPVTFDKDCRSCHALEFDQHIQQAAPHGDVKLAQAFVIKSITDYAQAHPDVVAAEIRQPLAEPLLPGQPRMPQPHTTAEWIANREARAEVILWRGRCALCHRDLHNPAPALTETQVTLMPASYTGTSAFATLPQIEPAHQPLKWYKDAVFSHAAHQAEECVDCHAAALQSQKGSDLLMPSIATCRRCHDGMSSPQGPPVKIGHAESGCFLCHVYHGPDQDHLASDHTLAQLVSR
jgi:hypothetical protein